MIIYTNEGNPLGLNFLLLAKFAKQPAEVKHISLQDAKAKGFLSLPTLVTETGLQLFSFAAAGRYLFPKGGDAQDEWLEWTSSWLAPSLAHHLDAGHRADPKALAVLNFLVKKLDERLHQSRYLTGEEISAADICAWGLLSPDGTLKSAQNIDYLCEWYRKVEEHAAVQEALAVLPLKSLTFSALQKGNTYVGLQHVPLVLPNVGTSSDVIPENVSNLADTITDEELKSAEAAFVYSAYTKRDEPRTVLPKAGERNVLITSALPYVNNVPHLGNIIGCVLSADIFARYSRTAGYNTLYISGTDEYGTATENKALAENLTPQQICDKYFELHNGIYRWFGIGFDYFGRTTTSEQTEIVQDAFKQAYEKELIFVESVDQLLCQKCDRFLADRFVEGTCPHPGCGYEDARGDQCDKCGKLVNATELIRPRCKVCSTAPVIRSSDQLFLDLPKIEPRLKEWVDRSENGWSNNSRVITRAWLREGLKPRAITRDLKWGISVPHPGFEKKVFYVWFDAVFGYVSMTKRYTKEYEQWWRPKKGTDVELFQFMAKDNVPFHSVIWPSILIGIDRGYTLVSHLMATEYLNYEDGKFSKSRNIGVFGNDAQETGIPADIWRFYLASARPEGQDSSFSWVDLAARNNSELLNNLGNFINRALVFLESNYHSTVPEIVLTHDELALLALINRELRGYHNSLEKARLRDGIRHLLSVSRLGNGYLQSQKPWVLLKGSAEDKVRASTVIGICCNIANLLASMMFPYIPTTARTLFKQLNTPEIGLNPSAPLITIRLPAGHKIGKPAPLFKKLEQSQIDELKSKYSGAGTAGGSCTQSGKESGKQNGHLTTVELEGAIQRQGEKVRQLKASTKDKGVWQPEVNILLDLKKQLAAAQAPSKCAGAGGSSQQAQVAEQGAQRNGHLTSVELEGAIQRQGEKVRTLKASTKDKSVWQPEVNILLDLKKQLAAAQATSKSGSAGGSSQQAQVAEEGAQRNGHLTSVELEGAVQRQGEKVRQLKASTKDKSVWQPEVNILLDLKKQLAATQAKSTCDGPGAAAGSSQQTKVADENPQRNGHLTTVELESAIQRQGEKVRQLKASTKDKSVWQPEVNILLNLKKQLVAAQATTK